MDGEVLIFHDLHDFEESLPEWFAGPGENSVTGEDRYISIFVILIDQIRIDRPALIKLLICHLGNCNSVARLVCEHIQHLAVLLEILNVSFHDFHAFILLHDLISVTLVECEFIIHNTLDSVKICLAHVKDSLVQLQSAERVFTLA